MVKGELREFDIPFEQTHEKKYGNVFLLPLQEIVICEFTDAFVLPEDFKKMIEKAIKIASTEVVSRIVIDLRKVQAFHQPSVEWLWAVAAEHLYGKQIIHYCLMLTDEEWYEDLIRLTIGKVNDNHPQNHLEELKIQFCKSFYEAVK